MSGTAELLDRVLRKEISLREYERLCGLPPMEEDEDLIAEMEEYAREFD
jgi:hypothetical protein